MFFHGYKSSFSLVLSSFENKTHNIKKLEMQACAKFEKKGN